MLFRTCFGIQPEASPLDSRFRGNDIEVESKASPLHFGSTLHFARNDNEVESIASPLHFGSTLGFARNDNWEHRYTRKRSIILNHSPDCVFPRNGVRGYRKKMIFRNFESPRNGLSTPLKNHPGLLPIVSPATEGGATVQEYSLGLCVSPATEGGATNKIFIKNCAASQPAPSGRCSNHLQRSREMLLPSSRLRSGCDSDRQRLRAAQTHAVLQQRNRREQTRFRS